MDPADFHKTVPAPKIVPINDLNDSLSKSPTRSTFSRQHIESPASFGSPEGQPRQSIGESRFSTGSRGPTSPGGASLDRPLPRVPSRDDSDSDSSHGSANAPHMGAGSGLAEPFGGFQPGSATASTGGDSGNPFGVDLVIPYDVSLRGAERNEALYDVQAGYTRLIGALESVGGLRIASRPGRAAKGSEEVWVFVGASDHKINELLSTER